MNIRSEIRRILMEELRSLANPLDKGSKAISVSTDAFQTKVDDLKKRAKREKDDINTNLNAKKKAKMVPQGNDPEIERERRQLMDKEISDLDLKRKEKSEQGEEIDSMVQDLGGLTNSLAALEKERDQLRAALAMNGEQGGMDLGMGA